MAERNRHRALSERKKNEYVNRRRKRPQDLLRLNQDESPMDYIQAELIRIGAVPQAVDSNIAARQSLLDS